MMWCAAVRQTAWFNFRQEKQVFLNLHYSHAAVWKDFFFSDWNTFFSLCLCCGYFLSSVSTVYSKKKIKNGEVRNNTSVTSFQYGCPPSPPLPLLRRRLSLCYRMLIDSCWKPAGSVCKTTQCIVYFSVQGFHFCSSTQGIFGFFSSLKRVPAIISTGLLHLYWEKGKTFKKKGKITAEVAKNIQYSGRITDARSPQRGIVYFFHVFSSCN